ncbi:F-box protein SKIP23 [Trifolium repens]|nr:F-box protein SKIP23 [Trifolium repens]
MAVVADWSKLPKELLYLISERLHIDIDLIHFRSVCSHWRTSSITSCNTLHFKLPFLKYNIDRYNTLHINNNNNNNNTSSFSYYYLSKCSHFLIKPPSQQQLDQTLVRPPWLVQITKNSSDKTIFFHPQFSYSLPSYDFRLTHLDFNKLSVIHLGTDFFIENGSMHPKKVVAVTPLILAILLDNNRLALFRCCRWTVIPDLPWSIGDICVFKGWIYAIQLHGRLTVTVGPEDLSVRLVANPGGMGDRNLLVESEGELLLVESFWFESTIDDVLRINVFRLDEKYKKWELTSLGNRILFMRNGCSFSASALDLSVAKGNRVIFMDNRCILLNKICDNASGMYVFDLDQGRVSPLSDYPDYLNLFWPPPEWIGKSYMPTLKKRAKQRKRTRDTTLGSCANHGSMQL